MKKNYIPIFIFVVTGSLAAFFFLGESEKADRIEVSTVSKSPRVFLKKGILEINSSKGGEAGKIPLNLKVGSDSEVVSENISQHFIARYSSKGLSIQSMPELGYWDLHINPVKGFGEKAPKVEGGKVSYVYEDGVTEWFENSNFGIEQGIDLEVRPSKYALDANTLEFRFEVESELEARESGGEIIFSERSVDKLSYSKLFAYDANGTSLDCQLDWDHNNSEIVWTVDDEGAEYPLVIDPNITTFVRRLGNQVGTDPNITNGGAEFAFGTKVEVSGDTLVATAPNEGFNATTARRGAVYVYQRNVGGSNQWGFVQKIFSPDSVTEGRFSVDLALEGDTLILSQTNARASGVISGRVYIYQRNPRDSNNWQFVRSIVRRARNNSGNFSQQAAEGDGFGQALALDGDLLAVGAPQRATGAGRVVLYSRNEGGTNNWGAIQEFIPQVADDFGRFGDSLELENGFLAIGQPNRTVSGNIEAGVVNLYAKDQGGVDQWGFVKEIRPSEVVADQEFGTSIVIDGDRMVVGAPNYGSNPNIGANEGRVYTYERNVGGVNNWGEVSALSPELVLPPGQSLGSSPGFGDSFVLRGDRLVVGASNYTFLARADNYNEVDDRFNNPINIGAALFYSYDDSAPNKWVNDEIISDPFPFPTRIIAAICRFGESMALDGNTLIIGSPGFTSFDALNPSQPNNTENITRRGAAYVYSLGESLYETWQGVNFTSGELGDGTLESTLWGVNADPDGDGIPNIQEAYFNTGPRSANTIENRFTGIDNSLNSIRMQHPVSSVTNGVSLMPEWSPNLGVWYESGQGDVGVSPRTINQSIGGGLMQYDLSRTVNEREGFLRMGLERD